jgi:DAACS family dicarboxylate/amino acid:cation (Na+ or H+) symporter
MHPQTNGTHSAIERRAAYNPLRWPLYLRVLIGVIVGATLGILFGDREIVFGWKNADLAVLGGLYIRLLTVLATPLIFFAIVDAFVQTRISGWQGLKLAFVCCINIAVAFAIGLTVLNVWQPGRTWQGTLVERATDSRASNSGQIQNLSAAADESSLSLLKLLDSYVPKSIVQPAAENMVLTVAVLAIFLGAAMRSLKSTSDPRYAESIGTFERLVTASFQILLKMLLWLIEIAPFAICLAIAGVVGATEDIGALLQRVGVYFVTVMAALGLHALVYYPLSAWLIGGVSPRTLFREGAGAIVTGFSVNSSLATAPLTLKALDRMHVSESSARLSACVGTNFNNDGITLYEAITALFVAQAAGMDLHVGQQVTILLAALAGSMGIAGIPNSGLIILTLVLKAARLPDDVVNLVLPIVYSIDFINARVRSAVNVMGDMQVAILLDAGKSEAHEPNPASSASFREPSGQNASDGDPCKTVVDSPTNR